MIAKMKKFYLFFTGDPSDFLREAQRKGIVEVTKLPDTFGFENIPVPLDNLKEMSHKLEFLKNILKKVEGKIFSGKIVITRKEEEKLIKEFPLDDIYEKFFKIYREVERRKKILEKLEVIKKELLLIKGLNIIPADLFSMKNFSFCLFALPKKYKAPDSIDGFRVEVIGENLFLIIFPLEKQKEIIKRIEEMKGALINIRKWNRLPYEILKKVEKIEEKNISELEKTEELQKEITSFKYRILVFYDYINSISHYIEAKANTGMSKFVQCISGWIKQQDIPQMELLIQRYLPTGYIHISDPDVKDDVPISFDNRPFIQPFEVVTDLYGKPVYTNIDPTPHLSIFFILSFAFCLTDAAYGFILIALSLIFMKKFRYIPAAIKFFRLLFYSGIATLFFGAITGGWFGDILARLPSSSSAVKILNKLVILNPLEGGNKTFIFLGWALILGYIQIVWGLYLNLLNSLRQYGVKRSGEPFILLIIQVIVAGLIIAFVSSNRKFIPPLSLLLSLSFLSLMILKGLTQKGFMRIFWAFYGAYNVIAGNLLGDVLSYSRLFGLGLTTAILALVVNEMVFMAKGIPFAGYIIAVLLFIFGHLANLGINLLGGYVHTSRLQYLEFFTKFFEGGGRPFSPLKESRQYTYLKLE
ncbi:MAG: hypothetical protein NC824_02355 [Candidatus Omnitrophica bacterium]|nr:hypothetical protein [Candidatus Omnitrophota bacterium]